VPTNPRYVDYVFSGWTRDGLEFDQDIEPTITGDICYGHWIKLGDHILASVIHSKFGAGNKKGV
jgi:hypothetical protein